MMTASAMNVAFDVALAKIKPPQRSFASIDRDGALDVLIDCLSWKVVIIEAPFGFAKSGFMAEACRRLGEGEVRGRSWRTAWLSVDEADDRMRLCRHVLAALRTLWPELEVEALVDLYRSDPDLLMVTLSNFLLEHAESDGRDQVLFVDDLHKAQPDAVAEFLNLTARFFPDTMHVVATGNRLLWESVDVVLQDRVRLFPSEKLNFSEEEVGRILKAVMERRSLNVSGAFDQPLPLPQDDELARLAHGLWEATAGWPFAVRLYAEALSRGTVGFSPAVDERSLGKMLSRYFRRNVLDALPKDLQGFLVDIALPDAVCADLCEAITGRDDAKFVLRDLRMQGYFIKPVAGRPGWYTFHPLLLRWLRSKQAQMDADRFNGLCLAAGDWFEANDMPLEAAKCVLMASDSDFIEGLISAIGYETKRSGVPYAEWVGRIPARLFPELPHLALQAAWGYLLKGRMRDGWRWVQLFEEAAMRSAEDDEEAVLMEVALAHEKCLEFDCRYEEAIEAGEALLERHAGGLSIQQSCLLLHSLGESYAHCGRFGEALKCYLQAEVMSELGKSDLFFVLCQTSIVKLYCMQGKMKDALALCEKAERASRVVAFSASALALKARVQVEMGRFDRARECLDRAYEIVSSGYNVDIFYEVEAEHARYLAAVGQGAQAFGLITKTAFQLDGRSVPRSIDLTVYLAQVDISLSMGYVAEAEAAAKALRAKVGGRDIAYQLMCAAAEAAVHDAAGEARPASELLSLIERAHAEGLGLCEMQLCIRAAERLARDGLHAEAIVYMTRALRLQGGQRVVGPFLRAGGRTRALLHEIVDVRKSGGQVRQLAKAVLRSFGEGEGERDEPEQSAMPVVRFGLTEREMEVLDLLDAGLSRREIAEALSVSLNTVKSHVSHIYDKLGVTNRIDAFLVVHDGEE